MPQNRWTDGTIEIVGIISNKPERKLVGEKGTVLVSCSVFIGKHSNDNPIYINCSAFNQCADVLNNFKKGDIVHVIGHIQEREYTNKNGEQKKSKNLICDYVNGIYEINDSDEVLQCVDENKNSTESKNNDLSDGFEEISSASGDLPF